MLEATGPLLILESSKLLIHGVPNQKLRNCLHKQNCNFEYTFACMVYVCVRESEKTRARDHLHIPVQILKCELAEHPYALLKHCIN